jgi:hypothetical protein
LPVTCKFADGVVVPIPTRLLVEINMFAVEAATPGLERYNIFPAEPAGAGPVAPVNPVAPVAPVAPVNPVAPVAPVNPVAPVAPVNPVAPDRPVAPVNPFEPPHSDLLLQFFIL